MGSEKWRKQSNLQCFLDRTTPFVATQSVPKTSIRDSNSLWHANGKDTVECFTLGELWDQFYEWSAYGLGVPIVLANGETVVQYYVPHLSAIQIYTTKSLTGSRNGGEDTESDSWSDDSESEKLSKSWDDISDDSAYELDGFCFSKDRIGQLYCQYIEYCPPYGRVPLVDKVAELVRSYPGLLSLKSVELSPASWMSISWYPITHIPCRRRVNDLLSATFLTYHTISSSFQDDILQKDDSCTADKESEIRCNKPINQISLPPFGLATYKMQANFWVNPEMGDPERVVTLYSAADSWLKQLRVNHHDFNFFTYNSTM